MGSQVPLKLTSMNFELMAGMGGGDTSGGSGVVGGVGAMGVGFGLGAPHSGGGLSGSAPNSAPHGGNVGGAGSAGWHPMSGGHDSFFLPSSGAKPVGLSRGVSDRRGARGAQWRVLDAHGPR